MTITNDNTPYDDVFRTETIDCPWLLLPVINEVFCEDYSGQEIILQTENEIFLKHQDGKEEKRITDTSLLIKRNESDIGKGYHLECQSTKDYTIIVRMYEYDSQIALKNGELEDSTLTVRFPHSALLYLRTDSTTPDAVTMRIETAGGIVSYQIPLIKVKNYDIQELFDKHLFFLVPFRIFVHEKDLLEYENNPDFRSHIIEEFIFIRNRLQECCEQGIIDTYTKCTLIDMSKKVIRNLLHTKYPTVRKELEKTMGGNVLEYEAKTILNKGKEAGRLEGLREGRLEEHYEGLAAFTTTLKGILVDFDAVYHKIIATDLYKDVTREQVRKYYDGVE